MKSANLAWRSEPLDEPIEPPPGQIAPGAPHGATPENPRPRPRPRFDRRTIEIRDQGFALFRIR